METSKLFFKVAPIALGLLLLAAVFAVPATADVTYMYTGEVFTYSDFPTAPTTSDSITGYFTVSSPLPPSMLPSTPPGLESYYFTDGSSVFSNTTSPLGIATSPYSSNVLNVATGAGGAIDYWLIVLAFGTPAYPSTSFPIYYIASALSGSPGPDYSVEEGVTLPTGGITFYEAYTDTTGTWSTVPEPTTMLLLGSGLLGLAAHGRKKFFKK